MSINAVIVIDCETGGLNPAKNPVTQIAYQAFELDSYKPILEWSSYIKPYDTSLQYEKAALDYTGITMSMLENEGLPIKDVVAKMCEDFSKANTNGHTKKPIMLGHNIGFDIGYIHAMFKFCKADLGKYFSSNKNCLGEEIPQYYDTLLMSKQKWANDPKMTKYNLSACCSKAGVEITDAHHAMNDVKATKELFFYLTNGLRSGSTEATEDTIQHTRFRNHFQF